MANRLVKLVDYEYLPAIREVIARPAYCTTVTIRVPVTVYSAAPDPGTIPINTGVGYGYPVTTYKTVRRTVCYPAVEGVEGREAQRIHHTVVGWDAGARSVGQYIGDFYLAFDFNEDGSGMLCGLTPVGTPVGEYNAIRYGLLLSDGMLSVVESGVTVASTPFVPQTRPSIYRVGGVVTYRAGDWSYTSPRRTEAPLAVNACLYVSGDFIDNPEVVPVHRLQADSAWGWVSWDTAFNIRATAPWGWGGAATMGDGFAHISVDFDLVASQEAQGTARLDVGGVGILANDAPRISTSGVSHQLPVGIAGQGTSVSVGSAHIDGGGAIVLAADYSYGGADLIAASVDIVGLSYDEFPGTGIGSDLMAVADAYVMDPVVYAWLDNTLTVGSSIDVLVALDAALVEYLIHDDDVSATMVMSALLASNLKFSDNVGAVRAAVLQYTTNLLTGGVGRYEGFDFSGFVRVGMDTYGWKRDGLYRLGYAEDTGEQIQAMIEFAAEDFDTTTRKSIRALFFGVDTDGALYARLVDDNDCDATYRVIPHGDTQRANPAQRPTSRFWRLRLEIVDATFADLDNVEWKAATTGRRTRS